MRVFLSGPMGSGKSTLGRKVAVRLGVPAYDLDQLISDRMRASIPEIFTRLGEAGFRSAEADALGALLAEPGDFVLALGGGTVTQAALRERLLDEGTLVSLTAPLAVLLGRVRDGAGRPLLAGDDPAARLALILKSRRAAYAECHGVVDTNAATMERQVEQILALAERKPIAVPLGERSYRVEVASGVREEVFAHLGDVSSVILVTDETVAPLWLDPVTSALDTRGIRYTKVILAPGESEKNIHSVQRIWETALSFGIDRRSLLVGVGGGVVGDMTGFAAATLLRGIRVGHLPTTLLSMVDSAIGGKTGFDTAEGKNLIGAFHQPSFVLADPETLRTLPDAEFISGFAEVVKSAWIEGEAAVSMLERDAGALLERDPAALRRAIRMSCKMKARIVTADEREGGLRAVLNLGHTVGHAIEAAQGYGGLRHGEAVALGMVAACRLAERLAVQSAATGQRLRSLLAALRLPVEVDQYLDDHSLSFMAADKKRAGAKVTFVVPGEPGDLRLMPLSLDEVAAAVRS